MDALPLQILLGASALAAMVSILVGVVRTGISPMPSSGRAIQQVLQFVRPTRAGPIYELGAAWGSLVIPLASEFPERRIIAYELSTIPWLFLSLRVRLSGRKNIEVIRRDFYRDDMSKASVVVCYLYPRGMERLATKLQSELCPGTAVVSNTFALPGWAPEQTAQLTDLYRTKIYRFIVTDGSAN